MIDKVTVMSTCICFRLVRSPFTYIGYIVCDNSGTVHYGIHGTIFQRIKSFLSNQSQQVLVEDLDFVGVSSDLDRC